MIDIVNLSKWYGTYEAVRELTLNIRAGEIFALLGPNGAGKTTTLRMLMGILQPTTGKATVRNLDCFAERAEVMKHVGFMPDEPVFFDYLRGSDVIAFTGGMRGMPTTRIEERTTFLSERLDITQDLMEYAVNYSHGMKKKLALICAMIHDPPILILDEPTNGLDPISTRAVHDLLRAKTATGGTVLLCTHLLDQVEKLSHRIGMLAQGRLVATGTLDELKKQSAQETSLEEIFFSLAQAERA